MIRALLAAGLLAVWSLTIAGCADRTEPAALVTAVEPAPASELRPLPVPPRNCEARADLLKRLQGEFNEQLMAVGVAGDGRAAVELHATRNGSSWTLLLTLPNGVSCLLASGNGWQVDAAIGGMSL